LGDGEEVTHGGSIPPGTIPQSPLLQRWGIPPETAEPRLTPYLTRGNCGQLSVQWRALPKYASIAASASLDILPGAEKMERRNIAVELTACVTSRWLSFQFGNQWSVRRITRDSCKCQSSRLCLVEWEYGGIPFGRHNYYSSG
ncbi:hypothetical protein B0H13DRAFT_1921016, partial [Mycena leptocephala]